MRSVEVQYVLVDARDDEPSDTVLREPGKPDRRMKRVTVQEMLENTKQLFQYMDTKYPELPSQ